MLFVGQLQMKAAARENVLLYKRAKLKLFWSIDPPYITFPRFQLLELDNLKYLDAQRRHKTNIKALKIQIERTSISRNSDCRERHEDTP